MKMRAFAERLDLRRVAFGALASLTTQIASVTAIVTVTACGGASPPPEAPSSTTPAVSHSAPAPATTASASDGPTAASGAEPAAPTKAQQRKLEITSQCGTPVGFFVGDDPKAGGSGRRSVDPLAKLPVERRRDGTQVVWLLDDKQEPLIKVDVNSGMNLIEIGRSCRTLDARLVKP